MSKQSIVSLAAAARIGSTTTSSAVDISDFTGLATLVMNSSATEGAGMTSDVKITHCDTSGGSYTDAGIAFTQVTNAAASFQTQVFSVDGLKKYIKVVTTLAGSSPFVTRSVELVGNLAL